MRRRQATAFFFLFLNNRINGGIYKNYWKVLKKWSRQLIPTHQIRYINNNEKLFITYTDVEKEEEEEEEE